MTHAERMARFLAGHWTKERPTAQGYYPTRDASGRESSPGWWAYAFAAADGRVVVVAEASDVWFWSEPWPGMPEDR